MAVREDDLSRRELAASIASMYYLDGQDQNSIAASVGISRSSVSRIITEARQSGIVRITIERPLHRDHDLEEQLGTAFGLRRALVVGDAPGVPTPTAVRVGALAARHLQDELAPRGTLGISWGESVAAVAAALPEDLALGVHVVQMIGASGTSRPAIDGPELAQTFARRLGGDHRTLNAPLVVDDAALALALVRQPSVARVLEAAAGADMALIGLGTLEPRDSSLLRAGYVGQDELAHCADLGVVGDAAGHMLGADGAVIPSDLGDRMVTLDEASLRGIPQVVAVAHGASKVQIIRASLRSGLVHVLVSDAETVRAVLAADR